MDASTLELIKNKRFEREFVEFDNKHFDGCIFIQCTFVYRGGPFWLTNFTADDCGLEVRDAALWTLQFFSSFQLVKPEFITHMNQSETTQ
jgi:hypothetical protein